MEIEIYKQIPGYKNYEVSNFGNVKSLNYRQTGRPNLLKQKKTKYGYMEISIYKDKKPKFFKVHQLVAMAFLRHKPNGFKLVVNHKNFIRTDNNLDNLEVVTMRENGNMKHLKSKSKYTGVTLNERNKWRARITINNKQKHLGYFDNEMDASIAYQKELIKI